MATTRTQKPIRTVATSAVYYGVNTSITEWFRTGPTGLRVVVMERLNAGVIKEWVSGKFPNMVTRERPVRKGELDVRVLQGAQHRGTLIQIESHRDVTNEQIAELIKKYLGE